MRTFHFKFHNEREEKVLLAFLDSLNYDYQVDGQEGFQLTEEHLEGFVQTKRNFLEGKTTARCWKDIKREL